MNSHQRHQRFLDLQGELKQARDVLAECERDLAEKDKARIMAQSQRDKANDRLDALEAECIALAEEAKAEFMALIQPVARELEPA